MLARLAKVVDLSQKYRRACVESFSSRVPWFSKEGATSAKGSLLLVTILNSGHFWPCRRLTVGRPGADLSGGGGQCHRASLKFARVTHRRGTRPASIKLEAEVRDRSPARSFISFFSEE